VKYPIGKYLLAYDHDIVCRNTYPDIKTIHRSEESANSGEPLLHVLADLTQIKEDYLFFLNPCLALLKSETIDKALDFFAGDTAESMTSVVRHHTWFFDAETGTCLTSINYKELDSKLTVPVVSIASAFHVISKKTFFETGRFLNENTYLYEIPINESFDVNDPQDFFVTETLYIGRKKFL
jgi:CMP-N-acetylneuraminic acid synthetase